MNSIKLKIELLSEVTIGSGNSVGTFIDSDVVMDEFGIPYIPAKRIKGCLRDSILELIDSPELTKLQLGEKQLIDAFGSKDGESVGEIIFSNLYITQYSNLKEWCNYLIQKENPLFNKESIISFYTDIQRQTAIENDTAKDHSLRSFRVLQKGLFFESEIYYNENKEDLIKILSIAVLNLKNLGTRRNRGFGKVECSLIDSSKKNIAVSTVLKMAGKNE